jgi:DNA-binding transcriptional ArsR family regulator
MQRERNNHATATHNGSDVTPLARSPRELAMLVERQSEQVNALLSALQAERAARESAPPPAPKAQPKGSPRDQILRMLEQQGHVDTVQICKALGITRQQVSHHVGTLENELLAVTVRGKRGADGRRGPDVVYHASAIAL